MSHQYRKVSETQLSQDMFNKVLCPNLRTGIRMGLLNPDAEGWVKAEEMRSFLEYIGLFAHSRVQNILISTAISAPEDKKSNHINITAFKNTFLDHGSSSGILNNSVGFDSERLALLKGFADPCGRIMKKDLALAANKFHQCPHQFKSFKGTNIWAFEVAGLLEIYGRKDAHGEMYFTVEDIDSLWRENRFPDGWLPPKKSFFSSFSAFKKYFSLMVGRLGMGWKNK